MSWGLYTPATPADELEDAIDALTFADNHPTYGDAERIEQLAAAKEAAKALFHTGVVGSEGEFQVYMNGHANPDHVPQDNWAGDMVSVSVSHLRPATPKA